MSLAQHYSSYQYKFTGSNHTGVIAQTTPYVINSAQPSYAFQLNASPGRPVLTISKDGEAQWTGKPSEAAEVMIKHLNFRLEESVGVTKTIRRRYYYQACKNILAKAESMTHEEFIDFLRKHVYTRESQVIMDTLKNEQN